MQSIFIATLLATGSLLGLSAAFDPDSVDNSTRKGWCADQTYQCPNLCVDLGEDVVQNKCYPDNLYYICQCTNGVQPNLTEYSQTIPYYECTTTLTSCIGDCGSSNNCVEQCRKDNLCGAQNPKHNNATSSASTTTATATASSTSGGSEATGGSLGGSQGGGSGAGALVLQLGSAYGLAGIAALVAGGAALVGI